MVGKWSWGWFVAAAWITVTLPGCGKKETNDAPNKAEAAVQTVLDAWLRGESVRNHAAGQEIQIVEPDWNAGWRLKSFLTVDTAQSDDNPDEPVRCRVSLSLRSPQGENVDKEVIYLVKLGSPVIISRAGRQ